ncbi:YciI family protein [Sphingobium aquiterrae]|uniref:YciI family protein n=1 Tax=Sphingobium aquiterrae TaxID=2038656 RepID=UPI003019E2A9
MFVISLTYKAPLAEVDHHLAAHVAWLDAAITEGWLLMAGRKEPRDGGILLARGVRETIARKAAGDPFVVNGVAEIEITEFLPGRIAPDTLLESLIP